MKERDLYQKFKEKIYKADPNCFYYKIPDGFGGGKRPWDSFLVVCGIPFAIEFKSEKGVLSAYQSRMLLDFSLAGGESLVFWQGRDDMDEFIAEKIIRVANEKTNHPTDWSRAVVASTDPNNKE